MEPILASVSLSQRKRLKDVRVQVCHLPYDLRDTGGERDISCILHCGLNGSLTKSLISAPIGTAIM